MLRSATTAAETSANFGKLLAAGGATSAADHRSDNTSAGSNESRRVPCRHRRSLLMGDRAPSACCAHLSISPSIHPSIDSYACAYLPADVRVALRLRLHARRGFASAHPSAVPPKRDLRRNAETSRQPARSWNGSDAQRSAAQRIAEVAARLYDADDVPAAVVRQLAPTQLHMRERVRARVRACVRARAPAQAAPPTALPAVGAPTSSCR